MGHTNSTPNLHLPQFIGSDKPTWLSDVNGAMMAIDTAYGQIEADASAAATAASGAVTTATSAASTASSAASTATTAASNASTALTTANNAATTANNAYTKAETALEKANTAITSEPRGSVSVNYDGTKTRGQELDELFAAMDASKITPASKLVEGNAVLNIDRIYSEHSIFYFSGATNIVGSGDITASVYILKNGSGARKFTIAAGGSASNSDITSEVVTSGTELKLIY